MPEVRVEYEQMQLHDGEDDAKTDQLSKLLGPLCDHPDNDWEGMESGITLYLHVNVDDTLQVSRDGWVRIVRATKMPDVVFTEKDL